MRKGALSMDWESIGKRIRSQREYLCYKRESFAEKIDVTPKFCSDIELGLKGMSVPTLCRISSVLNISVDYILFGSHSNNDNQNIIEMINRCPKNKLCFLEDIIKAFILSLN